jgi:hypothetical protein
VIPLTVIVCPATDTAPTELVVKLTRRVAGAVQPAGTATVSVPFESPPAGAVYVSVSISPVWEPETVGGRGDAPAPSAA